MTSGAASYLPQALLCLPVADSDALRPELPCLKLSYDSIKSLTSLELPAVLQSLSTKWESEEAKSQGAFTCVVVFRGALLKVCNFSGRRGWVFTGLRHKRGPLGAKHTWKHATFLKRKLSQNDGLRWTETS